MYDVCDVYSQCIQCIDRVQCIHCIRCMECIHCMCEKLLIIITMSEAVTMTALQHGIIINDEMIYILCTKETVLIDYCFLLSSYILHYYL